MPTAVLPTDRVSGAAGTLWPTSSTVDSQIAAMIVGAVYDVINAGFIGSQHSTLQW